MTSKKVSILILNWNGKRDTLKCLESLYESSYRDFEVVLVDNGSEDGSSLEFEKLKYDNLIFVKNKENLGFTGGNISGLEKANGDYVVLLNNDTLVDKDWLKYLVEAAGKDSKIGVIGGRAYDWNKANPAFDKGNEFSSYQKVDPYLGYVHTLRDEDKSSFCDAISGCAVLVKKKVIDEVGFLEPIFFTYYEETDLFARAIRKGYKVYYEPRAMIWHQSGKSSGGLSYFYLYHMARNRAVFSIRNFDEPYFSYFKKDYFRKGFRSFVGNIIKKDGNIERRAKANAFLWVLRNWSTLIKSRREIVSAGSYNRDLTMNNEETVSIIIPNYNYSEFIGEAIESALNQKVKPMEVIVVDDGSTDNSIEIIKKYPVKLIEQSNAGVIAAKNNGFAASKGRFILFLDADDKLREDAISEYLQTYRENKEVGFVYSDMEYYGSMDGVYKAKPFDKKRLRHGNYIHNSSFIKREAFEAVGGYHDSMVGGYEDWDMYISLVEQGYWGKYLPKVLLDYRRHDKELNRNEIEQREALDLIYNVYNRHRSFFPLWFVIMKKAYNKAYYGYGKVSFFLKILFFVFRILHKFFTLIKLLLTGRFKEATDKIFGEVHFWKAILQKRKK